jgi:DNA polymerase I-like protein with 3'-5' exonuclease and polymerase domains
MPSLSFNGVTGESDIMEPGIYKTYFKKEEIPFVYCTEKVEARRIIGSLMQKYPTDWVFGFDTETAPQEKYLKYPQAGLSPHLNRVRLIQIYTGKGSVVFDIFKIGTTDIFKSFFETYRFVAHYGVFDLKVLYSNGIKDVDLDCTMLMFQNLVHAKQPTDAGTRAGLAHITEGFFGIKVSKANQSHNWEIEELTYEQVEYSALDAVYVKRVYDTLLPALKNKKIYKYYLMCKKLQHVVAEMETEGIKLSRKLHTKHVDQWREELFEAKKELMEMTGLKKITAHTIADYLEKNLGSDYLDIWPRTDTGKLKTDAQVFSEFKHLEIVEPFSKFKELSKLTTSFGMNLLKYINPETSRIHPSYKICGARTGRLSCVQPNLQQMPRRVEIRKSFRPKKGYVFVSADYSMIELRVIAELSKDKEMLKAFRNGEDLHTVTASAISRSKNPTDEQRQVAKCANYGFIYGLGYNGLILQAKKLFGINLTMDEAKHIKDSFGDKYFGVATWQMKQAKSAQHSKEIRTPYGKLRKLAPDQCYGAAMNTPVQGGAAEVIFLSLIYLKEMRNGIPFKIISCIHDEIMLECPKKYSKEVAKILEDAMVKGYKHLFPKGVTKGLVDASTGKSWGEVH